MKNYFSLLLVLILISAFCITASASAEEPDELDYGDWASSEILTLVDPVYPTLEQFDAMTSCYPDGISHEGIVSGDYVFDSHIIYLYDNNGNFSLFAYDSSHADISIRDMGASVDRIYYGNYVPIFKYNWDDANKCWVYDKPYSAGSFKYSTIRSDFLIYTDKDIPVYQSDEVFYKKGTIVGIDVPSWQSLNYVNTFKDLPRNLMKEIVSILPIVIAFLVFSFAIYKGIRFLFSLLRSA